MERKKSDRFTQVISGWMEKPVKSLLLFVLKNLTRQKNFGSNWSRIDDIDVHYTFDVCDQLSFIDSKGNPIGKESLPNWAKDMYTLSVEVHEMFQKHRQTMVTVATGPNTMEKKYYEVIGGIGHLSPSQLDDPQWDKGFKTTLPYKDEENRQIVFWMQMAEVKNINHREDSVFAEEDMLYHSEWTTIDNGVPFNCIPSWKVTFQNDTTNVEGGKVEVATNTVEPEVVVPSDTVIDESFDVAVKRQDEFATTTVKVETNVGAEHVKLVAAAVTNGTMEKKEIKNVMFVKLMVCGLLLAKVSSLVRSMRRTRPLFSLQPQRTMVTSQTAQELYRNIPCGMMQDSGTNAELAAVLAEVETKQPIISVAPTEIGDFARWLVETEPGQCSTGGQAHYRQKPCGMLEEDPAEIEEAESLRVSLMETLEHFQQSVGVADTEMNDFACWLTQQQECKKLATNPFWLKSQIDVYRTQMATLKEAIREHCKIHFKGADLDLYMKYLFENNTGETLRNSGLKPFWLIGEADKFRDRSYWSFLMDTCEKVIGSSEVLDKFADYLTSSVMVEDHIHHCRDEAWVRQLYDEWTAVQTGKASPLGHHSEGQVMRLKQEAIAAGLKEELWDEFLKYVTHKMPSLKDMEVSTEELIKDFNFQKLISVKTVRDHTMANDPVTRPLITHAAIVGDTRYTLFLQDSSSVETLMSAVGQRIGSGDITNEEALAEAVMIIRMQKFGITMAHKDLRWPSNTSGKHGACSYLAPLQVHMLGTGAVWDDVRGVQLSDCDIVQPLLAFLTSCMESSPSQSSSKLKRVSTMIQDHANSLDTIPRLREDLWLSAEEWQTIRRNDPNAPYFLAPTASLLGEYQVIRTKEQDDSGMSMEELTRFVGNAKIGVSGEKGHMAVWSDIVPDIEARDLTNRLVEGLARAIIGQKAPVAFTEHDKERARQTRKVRNRVTDVTDQKVKVDFLTLTGICVDPTDQGFRKDSNRDRLMNLVREAAAGLHIQVDEQSLLSDVTNPSAPWMVATSRVSEGPVTGRVHPSTCTGKFVLREPVIVGGLHQTMSLRTLKVYCALQEYDRFVTAQLVAGPRIKLMEVAVARGLFGSDDAILAMERCLFENTLRQHDVTVLMVAHRHLQTECTNAKHQKGMYVNECMVNVMCEATATTDRVANIRQALGLSDVTRRKLVRLGTREFDVAVSINVVNERSGLVLNNKPHMIQKITGLKKGTDPIDVLTEVASFMRIEEISSIQGIKPASPDRSEMIIVCESSMAMVEPRMFAKHTDGTVIVESYKSHLRYYPEKASTTPSPMAQASESAARAATPVTARAPTPAKPTTSRTDTDEDGFILVGNGRKHHKGKSPAKDEEPVKSPTPLGSKTKTSEAKSRDHGITISPTCGVATTSSASTRPSTIHPLMTKLIPNSAEKKAEASRLRALEKQAAKDLEAAIGRVKQAQSVINEVNPNRSIDELLHAPILEESTTATTVRKSRWGVATTPGGTAAIHQLFSVTEGVEATNQMDVEGDAKDSGVTLATKPTDVVMTPPRKPATVTTETITVEMFKEEITEEIMKMLHGELSDAGDPDAKRKELLDEFASNEYLHQEIKECLETSISSGQMSGKDEMKRMAKTYAVMNMMRSNRDNISYLKDCYKEIFAGHNNLAMEIQKQANFLAQTHKHQQQHDKVEAAHVIQVQKEIEAIDRHLRIIKGETVTPGRSTNLQEARMNVVSIDPEALQKVLETMASEKSRQTDKKTKTQEGTAIERSKESSGIEESPPRKILTRQQPGDTNNPMDVDETTVHNTNSNNNNSISTNSDNNIHNNENDSDKSELRPTRHADSTGETDCPNHV